MSTRIGHFGVNVSGGRVLVVVVGGVVVVVVAGTVVVVGAGAVDGFSCANATPQADNANSKAILDVRRMESSVSASEAKAVELAFVSSRTDY